MQYQWIDEYLLQKKGAARDLKAEWNWVRYSLDGKLFAALCLDKENQPVYITVKLIPEEGQALRSQYEDIIPGYYMNKEHWNSIKVNGSVPDAVVKEILDKSYQLILQSLSKKRQKELLA